MKRRRLDMLISFSLVLLLVIGGYFYFRNKERQADQLYAAVIQFNKGTPREFVEAALGSPTHRETVRGVMTDTTAFLDESNSNAQSAGPLEEYDVFVWKSGTFTAVFYFQDGLVQSRDYWRRPLPRWWIAVRTWLP